MGAIANDSPLSGAIKVSIINVAPVWAAHPVGFALLTHGDQQFVAFYDAQRRMTLAQRTLGSTKWKLKSLPSTLGWDSHNSVTMALDSKNYLHVSGNMHAVPLIYFRGSKPLDIDSLVPVSHMTGQNEQSVTYPRFLTGVSGELLFSYRDGKSGDGNNLFNVYNAATRMWSRLLESPLMDGLGTMNAYMNGPSKGPDGYYHVSWVWRDSPDASTCHDLSYMRSRDLIHWETIDGKPLALPITIKDKETLVDPIPIHGGILNGMGQVGFDRNKHPVLSYLKYDSNGNSQLYLAHLVNGSWISFQASEWKKRFEFNGGGSLPNMGIAVGAVAWRNNQLTIPLTTASSGRTIWILDSKTMKMIGVLAPDARELAFKRLETVESTLPQMQVKWSGDLGAASHGEVYRLRWEAMPPNYDKPRDPPWPKSMLRVVELAPQIP